MIQWIAQPIFEDERSFAHSFIDPITRGKHMRACIGGPDLSPSSDDIGCSCVLSAGQDSNATPQEKRRMIEALSILHDFTAPFIHRKVRQVMS